jgi:nucleoside-diphosphate-sugar epimerase
MKRVVMSGGNGYIGSALIRRLVAEGVEVHALVNENHQRLDTLLPSSQIYVCSTAANKAADLVHQIQPDAVFHLAAVYAEPDNAKAVNAMIEGNLVLGANLLFAASKCSVPPVFINTGTYWQYSADGQYLPNTLYAATKQGFHDVLQFYRIRCSIPATTLVLYDVFGPHDDRPKLWNTLTHAAHGAHFALSPGTQKIYLVHVDDVVDAFMQAASALCSGQHMESLYAVRGDEGFILHDLLEKFSVASDLQLNLGWGELPFWGGVIQQPWRGRTLPDWQPQRNVLQSLLALAKRPS